MPLVRLKNVQLSFGTPPLLDHVNLNIKRSERVCILGRNGEGKSTLLKILCGVQKIDDGELWVQPSTKIVRLQQEVPQDIHGSVFDVVADGLGSLGEIVRDYHHISEEVVLDPSESNLNKMADIQHELEVQNGWDLEQRVSQTIKRLDLDPDVDFSALSGGMKRRVLLAQSLVQDPDVLLLDEPTNHLDISAIKWLESFLLQCSTTLIFITHDRSFLQAIATRIIEVDRGQLYSWDCNYADYLIRKEQALHAESQEQARFDKKLAQEEVWIRQGIKARRTRNEGRVRALKALRDERKERRDVVSKVNMTLQKANQGGKVIVETENVSYNWPDKCIVKDFNVRIIKGDRIAIVGPNGSGKSTLIKLLLGQLQPASGTIKTSSTLKVAYFDQLRSQLREDQTVIDNVADGHEYVTINGQQRHVMGYLQDFLFAPARVRQPVSALSGGERNRLLLARLFARPTNFLIMDEPTNDLDIETLELLEELLMSYDGTLILVSHDRSFVNNVVTSCLVMEGDGVISEYLGGYDDIPQPDTAQKKSKNTSNSRTNNSKVAAENTKKLTFTEQHELKDLPKKIETLEAKIEAIQEKMSHPDFFRESEDTIKKASTQLTDMEKTLSGFYQRWEELDI